MPASAESRTHRFLGAAETRRFLRDYCRKRVGESDVDDIVQTVLVEALASDRVPEEESEMRRWLVGVARHKIADLHRRGGREQPTELPDIETAPPPVEERELARWAEEQATSNREAQKTLQWMAREGEGDKLEHIAEEEQVPAARVRQRVSRMRRFMKERWLAELAAVAALAILAVIVWRAVREPDPIEIGRDKDPVPTPGPTDLPQPIAPKVAEATELRKQALESCNRGDHRVCLERLDRAKDLDPAGDTAPNIQKAREDAQKALEEQEQLQKSKDAEPSPSSVQSVTPPPTAAPPKANPKEAFPDKGKPTKAPPPKPKAESFDGTGTPPETFFIPETSKEATSEVMTPPPQQLSPPPQPPQQQQQQQQAFPVPTTSFNGSLSTGSPRKPSFQTKSGKK